MAGHELALIDFEGRLIIYRPLAGLAVVGNRALADHVRRRLDGGGPGASAEVEEFLEVTGFLAPDPSPAPPARAVRTIAVLLMTNACNLRCRYCYARAGENAPLAMDGDTAETAVRHAFQNAKAAGRGSFAVAFHGGGEPTLNRPVMERAVKLARSLPLSCSLSMSTNAMWDEPTRDFVLGNFDELSISFDGTEEAQNAQRPGPDGSPSFGRVMEAIRAVDGRRLRYGIRMTVTEALLPELPRGVRLLCSETSCPVIQVEPCYATRRGRHSDPDPGQGRRFVESFFEAYDIAAAAGRTFFYSGSRPWLVTHRFCGAPLDALIVTPQRDVVGCFEIHDRHHPLFDDFAIGRIEGDAVIIDARREEALLSRRSARTSRCSGCFNLHHCGGDCDSRCLGAGGEGRCWVNRAITAGLLARYIAAGDGVYRRDAVRPSAPCAACDPHGTT